MGINLNFLIKQPGNTSEKMTENMTLKEIAEGTSQSVAGVFKEQEGSLYDWS